MGISDRLNLLLQHLGENAVSFSEKLGIQRSSLSHLLSARNKPSVDFLEKLLSVYPNINLSWLISGIGEMITISSVENDEKPRLKTNAGEASDNNSSDYINKSSNERIESQVDKIDKPIKIVMFYKNGTFEVFHP